MIQIGFRLEIPPPVFSGSHFVKFYLNGGKYRLFAIFIGRRFGKITSACATDTTREPRPILEREYGGTVWNTSTLPLFKIDDYRHLRL